MNRSYLIGIGTSLATTRIYGGGISMGAYGAWDTISRHLDLFAVALAICGGVDIKQASRPKNIAIYNVHGTDDNAVPISRLSDIVNVLRNTGNNRVVYNELPYYGHNVWN